jgi:2,4-dienoyl-CoA reductase (NADPH2)
MTIHPKFPLTFAPIEIAGLTLPNRVIMGSMHTGLEETRGGFDKLAQFYGERAAGGAGLIVTGGIAPDFRGRIAPHSTTLWRGGQVSKHRKVTDAVHAEGGLIAMQILHGGRYSHHPLSVSPSAIQAPIGRFKPSALSARGVERTIRHFVRCARLAREAGYDGVEVMGSEGYLINQFIAKRTNHRTDTFGGSLDNRLRFPLEIVSRIREACGPDFAIIYRLSMLDLVDEGSSWSDIVKQAKAIEAAGASVINTGIGWHEARIPTIAAMVPRAGFAWVTKQLMGEVSVPLITTNRINDPTVIEQVLAEGCADMVSMARPFLADPAIMRKAFEGRSAEINTCIACNQACLDRVFEGKVAGCLVNPRAAKEFEWPADPPPLSGRYAVVGAGPAGLSCASELARRGAEVHLYEAGPAVGGQFRLAQNVPGKDEFAHTLRYFSDILERHGATVHLNTRFTPADAAGYISVVLSTGVKPRIPAWADINRSDVVSYDQVLRGEVEVGPRAAIIGSGGIGFDVADFLSHPHSQEAATSEVSTATSVAAFQKDWGVDPALSTPGGLAEKQPAPSPRELWMFQRKTSKPGGNLGKTTGWIHRATVKKRGIQAVTGASYQKVDDAGLHYEIDGKSHVLKVDHIVLCAGQLSVLDLEQDLSSAGADLHIIGGAKAARDLDAERAIAEGYSLARSFS